MKQISLFLLIAITAFGQAPLSAKVFDDVADSALAAMTKRAEELKIHGVAVVV